MSSFTIKKLDAQFVEAFGPNPFSAVTTFHPRLDIPFGAISEIHVANAIASQFGQKPQWVPYTYDIGFGKNETREKSAVAAYYENSMINMLSANEVGSKPVSAVKGFTPKHLQTFIRQMSDTFKMSFKTFSQQIDELKLGHPLFHMKNAQEMDKVKIGFEQSLKFLQQGLENQIGAGSFSDQLIGFNRHVSKQLIGADMDTTAIDHILAENDDLLDVILDNYEETQEIVPHQVKLLLDNERMPLVKKGQNFHAGDKTFNKENVVQLIKHKKATVNGELFLSVLNFMDHRVTLGGVVTDSYYKEMFPKAEQISAVWGKPFNLKYVLNSHVMNQGNPLNLLQTAATLKVMDTVATRNILSSNSFMPVEHVVEHLTFLGGRNAVPSQFLDKIMKEPGQFAADKKQSQIDQIDLQLAQLAQTELSDKELKDHLKKLKLAHPSNENKNHNMDIDQIGRYIEGYRRRALEDDRSKQCSQLNTLNSDIALEQIFLGGTVDDKSANGVVHRSSRFPSAIQFVMSGSEITQPELFLNTNSRSKYCIGTIEAETQAGLASSYSGSDIMNGLLHPGNLPFQMLKPR